MRRYLLSKSLITSFLFAALLSAFTLKVSATCQPNFSWTQTADNVISFTNTSADTTASTYYYWFFGDGTYSTDENAVHTYNTPGTYYVCLYMVDSNCNAYYCDSVTVTGIVICTMNAACYEYLPASCATCADGTAHSGPIGGSPPYTYEWNTYPVQTTSQATGLLPGTYTVCITDVNSCTACCTVTIDTVACYLGMYCLEYTHPSCATCADGEAQAYPYNGTAPYTYEWNTYPVQTTQFAYNLLPGTYTVCVTDANGCTACCSVTMDAVGCTMTAGCYQYSPASCPTCADGIAHSGPIGGTAPYTYEWNTYPVQTTAEATGLLPGTYTVCITDANGCTACCTVNIDTFVCNLTVYCYEYSHPSCDTCHDGVAHAFPGGGTAPYTYEWNTNPVQTTQFGYNLSPGTYTVCVTDANGCTACCTVIMDTVGCTMTANCLEYYPASCPTCADGAAYAYATGGTWPYTYEWNTYPVQTNPLATGLLPGTYTVCITDVNGCHACCTVTIDTVACNMTLYCYEAIHPSCATCADGEAHSFPSGGTAPYTYEWNTYPVQTTQFAYNLLPGTYTVCITDANGCTACCTVVMDTVGCTMTAGCYEYAHASCDTCADGIAHSYPIGGTYPYTYEWNTNPVQTTASATGLSPGSYTVCITDVHGCTACCTVMIDTGGCTMTANCLELYSASCATCADGAAYAYASGGTGPYTYEWNTYPVQTNPLATGLLPGTYSVCITDANGCTACCSVTIDYTGCNMTAGCYQYAPASCDTCADGIAHSYATGGTPPYSYLWNTYPVQTDPAATGLLPGTYTVLITDANGCSAYCAVTINNANPDCYAFFYLYPDSVIAHTYWAVNASTGAQPLSYWWYWGDGTYDTIPYPSHTYANAGYYTICLVIQDTTGCADSICNTYNLLKASEGNTIVYVNVIPNIPTSVSDQDVLTSWSVFPNPAGNKAFMNYTLSSPARVNVDLYDVIGNKLQQVVNEDQVEGEHRTDIDLQKLEGGVYLLKILVGGQVATQKIVVMK